MHTIAIVVSTSAAGLVGWSSRSSSKMAALIGAAGGRGRQPRTALPQVDAAQGWRSSARWALAVAVPTGIVAAGLPFRSRCCVAKRQGPERRYRRQRCHFRRAALRLSPYSMA